MKVVLLHDAIGAGSSVDELDVVAQMEALEGALAKLGHASERLAFGLDLESAAARLRERRPDAVFNLVESVGGEGRLVHLAPALLDSLRLAYTGAGTEATFLTANKLLAKERLRGAGIATPPWFTAEDLARSGSPPAGKWIIKSVWEHASRGIDDGAVVQASTREELREVLSARREMLGGEGFVEQFIEGREFNLSMLSGAVLPTAEITFEHFSAGQPRIVGYRAKWDEASFEYQHTPRRFEFGAEDAELLARLREMAQECWRVFGLRGYARVDFRVDESGRPWVLEVNTNPCLSPDAGFAAALQRAGISFEEAVEKILADAVDDRGASGAAEAGINSEGAREPEIPAVGEVRFRSEPRTEDAEAVRAIVASTRFFHDFEIDVAVELVEERLTKGLASEYHFVFADDARTGKMIGYACFGPVACTVGSVDLYWIAVHESCRGRGLGRTILEASERQIAAGLPSASSTGEPVRGRRVYIETSSKPQYAPTRVFYERCGYQLEARFADFYAEGDDKLVYVKALSSNSVAPAAARG